jgi:hypothetical protein
MAVELRRVTRVAALLGGVPVTISMVLGAWLIHDPYRDAVPTSVQNVGTCHRFASVEEYYNTADLRPPVPCTEPHQTETMSVGTLTGPLAQRGDRPGLEALNLMRNGLCQDETAIRKYLGAAPRDEHGFLQIVVRFPAPGEWRAGLRRYRCELMATEPVNGAAPVLTEPLRNAFRRPYGGWFRRCAAGARPVPCARSHDAEFVNAWLPVPSDVDMEVRAATACAPYVVEYLGRPVPGEYRVSATPVAGKPAPTAACQLVDASGASWTGARAGTAAESNR